MTATLTVPAPRRAGIPLDPHPVTGEVTEAFGLVIAPAARGEVYTGQWQIVRARSRLPVSAPTTLAYVREFAAVLARAGLDWTRPPDELAADPVARRALEQSHSVLQRALWDQRPLWWARSSWVSHGPLWKVAACRDGGVVEYEATFGEMWRLLDLFAGDSPSVGRPGGPTWSLRCAAPLCGPDRVATLEDPGDEDCRDLRAADRGLVARTAHAAGWTRHDTSWLCPRCSLDHFDDPDADLPQRYRAVAHA